jgi:hypothetical protein
MTGKPWVFGSLVIVLCLLLSGCETPETPKDLLAPTEAQLKLRTLQTRTFDVTDRNLAIRAVIASLQDLGFIIERANDSLGLVTAARFAEPNYYDVVSVTVTVRQHTPEKLTVRVNAIYNNKPIDDPKVYQNFFVALERSIFVAKE